MNWIKVTDRLPEFHESWSKERVAAFKDGDMIIGVLYKYSMGSGEVINCYQASGSSISGVTHWAEITPPKD